MKRKRDAERDAGSEAGGKVGKRIKTHRLELAALPAVLKYHLATFLHLVDHQKLAECSKDLAKICSHGSSFAESIDLKCISHMGVRQSPGLRKLMEIFAGSYPRKKITVDLEMAWWFRDVDLPVDTLTTDTIDYDYEDEQEGDGKALAIIAKHLTEWQPKRPVREIQWADFEQLAPLEQAFKLPAYQDIQKLTLTMARQIPFNLSALLPLRRLATLHLNFESGHCNLKPLLKLPSLTALYLDIPGDFDLPPELPHLPVVSLGCSVNAFARANIRGPISCSTLRINSNTRLPHVVAKFNDLMPQLRSLAIWGGSHNDKYLEDCISPIRDLKLDSLKLELGFKLRNHDLWNLPSTLISLDLHQADVGHLDQMRQLKNLILHRCDIANVQRLLSGLSRTVEQVHFVQCSHTLVANHLPDMKNTTASVSVECYWNSFS